MRWPSALRLLEPCQMRPSKTLSVRYLWLNDACRGVKASGPFQHTIGFRLAPPAPVGLLDSL